MASSKKNDNIKVEDLCRTCLAKEKELFPIFEIYLEATTLDHIITSITGVKIDKSDGLPTKICQECKDKAANAYGFKKTSQESEVTLQGILKEGKDYLITDDTPIESSESDVIDVKVERLPPDDQEDFIDLEFNLTLPTASNSFTETDVKSEAVSDSTPINKFLADAGSENTLEQSEKKCIKVEYELSNSTYCPLCTISYSDSDGLTKHMWESHPEIMGPRKRGRPKKMVTDMILNKLSENGYYLKTVPIKRLNCSFCKGRYKTKDELIAHMAQHKDIKVLCCVICKKMYLKKKYFDIHLCMEDETSGSLQENDPPPVVLPTKGEQDGFMIETELHQLLDLTNNPEACTQWGACAACSALLPTNGALNAHVDAHHPDLSLRCALCNKEFASAAAARRHRARCGGAGGAAGEHECAGCGQRFAHAVSLNKHILARHAGQRVSLHFVAAAARRQRHRCDTCERGFHRKDLLIKHRNSHKTGDKFFECDVCKKRFYRSDNLRSHMRVHREGADGAGAAGDGAGPGVGAAPACLCLYCGRSFSNSSNLIVHMRRHTGEKPYKCDFCDKGFPRSTDLQCHRRSHTGEKPYVCATCGKGFSRSNKLSRHSRVHSGARPYACPFCEKAFSQSNDLTLHVRRHTGDKPYVCDLCGDRFIQGTALHSHRRSHGPHAPPAPAPAPPSGLVSAHAPATASASAPAPAPLAAPAPRARR